MVGSLDFLELVLSSMSLKQAHALASTSRTWAQSISRVYTIWQDADWQHMWSTDVGMCVVDDCMALCAIPWPEDDQKASALSSFKYQHTVAVPDQQRARLVRVLQAAIAPQVAIAPQALAPRAESAVRCILRCFTAPRDLKDCAATVAAAQGAFTDLCIRKRLHTKEILRTTLRPVLWSVYESDSLGRPELLESCARLTAVLGLSSFFKRRLPEKLLDHLHQIPTSNKYRELAPAAQARVVVALINSCRPLISLGEGLEARLIEGFRRIPRPPNLALFNEQFLACLRAMPDSPAVSAAIVEIEASSSN